MEKMSDIKKLIEKQSTYFHRGETKEVPFRIKQLKRLKDAIKRKEKDILAALKKDLNKSEYEAYLAEIGYIYNEINIVMKHIKDWAKPQKVKTPITHIGSKSYIYREPYGVVLIISPWNYPFQLAIAPLIGAIAAGNCAVLKPSELTPATSTNLLAAIINETFAEHYIKVVEGGVEESQQLLGEKVDYIFFTGSVEVGKIVMAAAAKNLTPVTLELGGKSPTIVHHDADLDIAAKRIVWGKFINAGQTCIAPDYLLLHKNIKIKFIKKLKKVINDFYGKDPFLKKDFPMIVNEKHFERLTSYLNDGTIIHGGRYKKERRFIEPTIIDHVDWETPVMKDEIFGPILPIIEYETVEEVIEMVRRRPNPLALYLFSEEESTQEVILKQLTFGGGCINDTIYHIGTSHLPFGGVGESGIGSYHGKYSFETFSHEKSILKQSTKIDIPLRYPQLGKLSILRKLLK